MKYLLMVLMLFSTMGYAQDQCGEHDLHTETMKGEITHVRYGSIVIYAVDEFYGKSEFSEVVKVLNAGYTMVGGKDVYFEYVTHNGARVFLIEDLFLYSLSVIQESRFSEYKTTNSNRSTIERVSKDLIKGIQGF